MLFGPWSWRRRPPHHSPYTQPARQLNPSVMLRFPRILLGRPLKQQRCRCSVRYCERYQRSAIPQKAMQKGGRAREGNPNAPLASYPPSLVFGAILNCQTSPSAHEAVVGSAHPFLAVRPTRTWCARTYMPGKGPPPASNLVHGVHHSRIGYEGCDGRNNVNGSLK